MRMPCGFFLGNGIFCTFLLGHNPLPIRPEGGGVGVGVAFSPATNGSAQPINGSAEFGSASAALRDTSEAIQS
jgi:hypothetical protein